MMKYLVVLFALLFLPVWVFAQPSIDPSTPTTGWSQGESIMITGSGFGTKSPVAPFLWDDCESGVPEDLWDYVSPYEDTYPNYDMEYRSSGYRSVSVPHTAGSNSQFVCGGHKQIGAGYSASTYDNVSLYVTGLGNPDNLYVTQYHRLDPSFPTTDNSHYDWEVGQGTPPYGGPYCCLGQDCHTSSYGGYTDNVHECNGCVFDTVCTYWLKSFINNNWIRREWILMDGVGEWMKHDNVDVIELELGYSYPCDPKNFQYNYVGFGGYWRIQSEPYSDGDDDAFKYFDDIYIDTTMQRVILGDNQTYSSCTVLEPQIPHTTWNNTTIQVTVNLGKLYDDPGPGETVYLFVFDSDNEANSTGYEITIGQAGTPPVILNPSPSGEQTCSSNPQTITLEVDTDKNATVRACLDGSEGCDSSTTYDEMGTYGFTWDSTGGTSHSHDVSLSCEYKYIYYVRSMDSESNKNTSSTEITFWIDGLYEMNNSGSSGVELSEEVPLWALNIGY